MTIVAVYNIVIIGQRVGGMARAFTFHSTLDCILHRIFCGLSLFVLYSPLRHFPLVLWFFSLLKSQNLILILFLPLVSFH